MGNLPTSRTVTLATGDALPSNLVNEIQDVIVSEHASRAADRTGSLAGVDFIVQSGTASYNTTGDIASTASCVLIASIPLRVGDTIKSVSVVFDSATGTVDVTDFHVDRIALNGTATGLGSTTVNNIGAPTPTSIDLADTTLAVNQSFIVSISINATGCSVRSFQYTYSPGL
jgi:hypothetical protein